MSMKHVKRMPKRMPPEAEHADRPQSHPASVWRMQGVDRLKKPLLPGQCPHTGNNYCEFCIGDR